jgi:hypothetical protein
MIVAITDDCTEGQVVQGIPLAEVTLAVMVIERLPSAILLSPRTTTSKVDESYAPTVIKPG